MNAQRPLFAAEEGVGELRSTSGAHLRVTIDRARQITRLVKLDDKGKPLGDGLALAAGDVTALLAALMEARRKMGGG